MKMDMGMYDDLDEDMEGNMDKDMAAWKHRQGHGKQGRRQETGSQNRKMEAQAILLNPFIVCPS